MTKIFFYHNTDDRIGTLATLIGKVYRQRKSALIYAPEAELASQLDRRLWTHPPIGFVPHVRHTSLLAGETPIIITDDPTSMEHHERLFNLSPQVPPSFSRFVSVIEVVSSEDSERQSARERVKFYKDRGYAIQYFDLAEKPQ